MQQGFNIITISSNILTTATHTLPILQFYHKTHISFVPFPPKRLLNVNESEMRESYRLFVGLGMSLRIPWILTRATRAA